MKEGDKVWAPDPEGGGELKAVYIADAAGEPVTLDGEVKEAAWISYTEGEGAPKVTRVAFCQLRARPD